jgi:hypothetical protein
MRYSVVAMILVTAAAFALLAQPAPTPVAAADGVIAGPAADPVCFFRRRGARYLPAPVAVSVLGKKKFALATNWPRPGDAVQTTFCACGTDNVESWPLGTVLDVDDANYFSLGSTITDPPPNWKICFTSVRSSKNMIFRVESATTGESVDTDIIVDDITGLADCPPKMQDSQKTATGTAGEKLEIRTVSPGIVVRAGTSVFLEGTNKSGKKGGVYGLLIGLPGRKIVAVKKNPGQNPDMDWGVTFDTKGLEGAYILRVRRSGTKVPDERNAFDHRVIYVKK